jgi:FAD:protein FMN transferase
MNWMGLMTRKVRTIRFHRHPVLGTDATGSISSGTRRPQRLEEFLFDAIDNLENVFSFYRRDSEFSRWRFGELSTVSDQLLHVLARSEYWMTQSGGALNPSIGLATDLWAAAAVTQTLPADDALRNVAQRIATVPFRVEKRSARHLGDCTSVNLNAIAKGYIVDAASDAVLSLPKVESVVLNLGGDLIHRGAGTTTVAIQNPLRAYDNEPPLFTLNIANAAIATSGSAARGWQIGDTWFSHVIDPRTAQPISAIASATVVANTAMDADAIATVLSVVNDDERLRFTQQLEPDVAYCVVRTDSSLDYNHRWNSLCT